MTSSDKFHLSANYIFMSPHEEFKSQCSSCYSESEVTVNPCDSANSEATVLTYLLHLLNHHDNIKSHTISVFYTHTYINCMYYNQIMQI